MTPLLSHSGHLWGAFWITYWGAFGRDPQWGAINDRGSGEPASKKKGLATIWLETAMVMQVLIWN